MKTKLRRIHIESKDYRYSVSNRYYTKNETNVLTIRIYLDGNKNTPLIIEFLTLDHYSMGQVLGSGVNLENITTNTPDRINIHEPKRIKYLILQGMKNGWTGYNKLQTQDGIKYLNDLGYKTNVIEPLK
jgi:hypothetical protein